MANVKISDLPAASQANATDQLETNQGGTSRRLTVAQVATHVRSTATDTVVVAAGSASAPSIAPTGDSNTGIFFPAADTIAFSEGGVEALRLDSSGNATFAGTAAMASSFLRNRIINGDMRIDQRNAGAAVTYTVPVSPFITDRWSISIFGSTYPNPIMTAQQVTDAPATFTNSLRVTSSGTITPDANRLGAWIEQRVEGFNISDFAWGTASASAITISFWVKASRTGTVSISLENSALDRSYLTTATVLAANTWERKTVTIPGDTSGTWLTNNGIGLSLKFGIMSNGTWFAGTGGSWTGTRTLLSSSQTNFIALSSDNIAITGVQLEVGSAATPFERRQYGQELALCQRYYEKSYNTGVAPATSTGDGVTYFQQANAVRPYVTVFYAAQKRATPSVTIYNPVTGGTTTIRNGDTVTDNSFSVEGIGASAFSLRPSSGSAGAAYFHWAAASEL